MYKSMYIRFVCPKSKKMTSGTAPINCRITVSGLRAQFATGFKIDPNQWNAKQQKVKTKGNVNAIKINQALNDLAEVITDIYLEFEKNRLNDEINYSPTDIKEKVLGMRNNQHTQRSTFFELISIYLNYKKQFIDKKKPLGILKRTYEAHTNYAQHLEEFLRLKKATNLFTDQISSTLVDEYEIHLRYNKDFENNHTVRCMRFITTVINYAIQIKDVNFSPIPGYKYPPKEQTEIIFLTPQEKQIIEDVKLQGRLQKEVQDLFLFQCYTGFAYVDLYAFSNDCIFEEEKTGKKYIEMERTKTKVKALLPFFPKAEAIWNKYNHKLPKVSNANYNRTLKHISGLVDIEKNVTTHVARKTFATLALNSGVTIEVVAKCLGHSNTTTTRKIYAQIQKERIFDEFEGKDI